MCKKPSRCFSNFCAVKCICKPCDRVEIFIYLLSNRPNEKANRYHLRQKALSADVLWSTWSATTGMDLCSHFFSFGTGAWSGANPARKTGSRTKFLELQRVAEAPVSTLQRMLGLLTRKQESFPFPLHQNALYLLKLQLDNISPHESTGVNALENTVWMDSDLICQTTYRGGEGCNGIFPTTLNNSWMGCSGNAKGKWTKEEGGRTRSAMTHSEPAVWIQILRWRQCQRLRDIFFSTNCHRSLKRTVSSAECVHVCRTLNHADWQDCVYKKYIILDNQTDVQY